LTRPIAVLLASALFPHEEAPDAAVGRTVQATNLSIHVLIDRPVTQEPCLVAVLPRLALRTRKTRCIFKSSSVAGMPVIRVHHVKSRSTLRCTCPANFRVCCRLTAAFRTRFDESAIPTFLTGHAYPIFGLRTITFRRRHVQVVAWGARGSTPDAVALKIPETHPSTEGAIDAISCWARRAFLALARALVRGDFVVAW